MPRFGIVAAKSGEINEDNRGEQPDSTGLARFRRLTLVFLKKKVI